MQKFACRHRLALVTDWSSKLMTGSSCGLLLGHAGGVSMGSMSFPCVESEPWEWSLGRGAEQQGASERTPDLHRGLQQEDWLPGAIKS